MLDSSSSLLGCTLEWDVTPASFHCRVAREAGEDLTYPEWIELVALIAFVVCEPNYGSGRSNVVAGLGPMSQNGDLPLLTKLHLLFHNMYENGAKFTGESNKMIRNISAAVRAEADAAQKEAVRSSRKSTVEQQRHVQQVLGESILA